MVIAFVKELWRYPVKSLGGESLSTAIIGAGGVCGDRHWTVYDPLAPIIRSAKQWPRLLELRAQYLSSPSPEDYGDAIAPVRLLAPDGNSCESSDLKACEDWLTRWLDAPAQLKPRAPRSDRAFYALPGERTEQQIAGEIGLNAGEPLPEFGAMDVDVATVLQFHATPPGFLYDAFPVHLLTTDSLQFLADASGLDVDVRRFRPNLLLEMTSPAAAMTEQGWVGATLKIGEAVLLVDSPTARCSMPGRPQPGFDLREEKGLSRAMAKHADRNLGVNARIIQPGTVRTGDRVQLLPGRRGTGRR
ncbi:MOSC domain-containing protein [Haliea sp. E1-2-M8]|uniref:MOSC domain-containing protein n=1 Tax=Haliea sp. E1-2-M8 TaxID=3064706 RepID=UPI00271DFEEA|nr:MOSC N-terminal beta barrel domain-containing protein [Haliea sp. E1-2-M8]MDO8863638.1 MOSC domain-containing protein [Haliea sp. E1-2-M8]